MKLSFLFLAVLLALTAAPIHFLRAQANDQASGGGAGGKLAFLSAEDRMHFLKVRRDVLQNDPALKTEQESLQKEREFVKNKGTSATADDRQMLIQNFIAHQKNMRDAMVKDDPTIAPVLDQVEAKMKERFQNRAGGGVGTAGGTPGSGTAGGDSAAN